MEPTESASVPGPTLRLGSSLPLMRKWKAEYLVPRVNINPSRKSQLENLLYDWLSYSNWRIRIQKISITELTRINITPGDNVGLQYSTGTSIRGGASERMSASR